MKVVCAEGECRSMKERVDMELKKGTEPKLGLERVKKEKILCMDGNGKDI